MIFCRMVKAGDKQTVPFRLIKNYEYSVQSYKVEDGDTINVWIKEEQPPKRKHKVRLHGIDAPEYGQQMYGKSWGKLKSLCEKAESLTVLITDEKDKHGRPVGILYGHHKRWNHPLDINRTMVFDGYAYAYAYNGDDPYREEDHSAKRKEAGIRKELDEDVPPWEYRDGQKGKPRVPYYWRFLRPKRRSTR